MKFLNLVKISLLFFFTIVLVSCGAKNNDVVRSKPSIYDGSIGLVLGCMFSPGDCKKMKQEIEQEQITKEFEEVDKDVNSQKQ